MGFIISFITGGIGLNKMTINAHNFQLYIVGIAVTYFVVYLLSKTKRQTEKRKKWSETFEKDIVDISEELKEKTSK
jgi:uncharacterized membrane protein YgaE (UPF0421/DUF939 family)